jgi:hypothetical protein
MFGDTYGVRVSPWVPASVSELVDPGDPRAIGPCRLVGDWWWDPGAGLTATLKCATLEYELHPITDDGIHEGTLDCGLAANEVLKAFNSTYGLGIPLLKLEEILEVAGIEDKHGSCRR